MTVSDFHHYAQQALAPTEPLFMRVPPERKDWKPTDRSFTTGQLMYHIAYSLKFNANGVGKNIWELPSMRHVFLANRRTPSMPVAESIALYRTTSAEFLHVFATMSDEEFQNSEIDSVQLGTVKKWRGALFAIEHHINHKAELFMYLKIMGIDVTTKELYIG